MLDIALWCGLGVIALLVLVLVLVPFYMTGGNVPSLAPGWFPTEPDEFASIATFRGTIWEHSGFLQDAFWHVGYYACCFWLPLLLAVIVRVAALWGFLPTREKQVRLTILMGSVAVTGLWAVAIVRMLSLGD